MTSIDAQIAAAEQAVMAAAARPGMAEFEPDEIAQAAEAERLAVVAARTVRLRQAHARVMELHERKQRFHQAADDNAAARKTHAKRVATIGKNLQGSREVLRKAVEAALAVLEDVWDAAVEHNAAVESAAGELRAAGLVAWYEDGDLVANYPTGATPPADGAVVVDGAWSKKVDTSAVLDFVLYGLLRSKYGEYASPTAGHRRSALDLLKGSAGLLDGVRLPHPLMPQLEQWQIEHAEAMRAHRALMSGEHLISDQARREHEREQANEERRRKSQTQRAKAQYAEARAEFVRKHGEERCRAAEREHFFDGRPFDISPDAWADGRWS